MARLSQKPGTSGIPVEIVGQIDDLLQDCSSYDALITKIKDDARYRTMLQQFPFPVLANIIHKEVEPYRDLSTPERYDQTQGENGRSIVLHALALVAMPMLGMNANFADLDKYLDAMFTTRFQDNKEQELRHWLSWLTASVNEDDKMFEQHNQVLHLEWDQTRAGCDASFFLSEAIVGMMIRNHEEFRGLFHDFVHDEKLRIKNSIVEAVCERFSYDEQQFEQKHPDVTKGWERPTSRAEEHRIFQAIYGLALFVDLHRLSLMGSIQASEHTGRLKVREIIYSAYSTIWQLENIQSVFDYLRRKLRDPLDAIVKEVQDHAVADMHHHFVFMDNIENLGSYDFELGYFSHLISAHGLYNFRKRYNTVPIPSDIVSEGNAARRMGAWPSVLGLETLKAEVHYAVQNGILLSLLNSGWHFSLFPGRGMWNGGRPIGFGTPYSLVTELRDFLTPPWCTEEQKRERLLRFTRPLRVRDNRHGQYYGIEDRNKATYGQMYWAMQICTGTNIDSEMEDAEREYCRGDVAIWDDERLRLWGFTAPDLVEIESPVGCNKGGYIRDRDNLEPRRLTTDEFWRLLPQFASSYPGIEKVYDTTVGWNSWTNSTKQEQNELEKFLYRNFAHKLFRIYDDYSNIIKNNPTTIQQEVRGPYEADIPDVVQEIVEQVLADCSSYDNLMQMLKGSSTMRMMIQQFPFAVLNLIIRKEIEAAIDWDEHGTTTPPPREPTFGQNGCSIILPALALVSMPVIGIGSSLGNYTYQTLYEMRRTRKKDSKEDELRSWLRAIGRMQNGNDARFIAHQRKVQDSSSDAFFFLTDHVIDRMLAHHGVFRSLYDDFVQGELARAQEVILEGSLAVWDAVPQDNRTKAHFLETFPQVSEATDRPVSETEKHRIMHGIYALAVVLDLHRVALMGNGASFSESRSFNDYGPSQLCQLKRTVRRIIWGSYKTIWQLEGVQTVFDYLRRKMVEPMDYICKALRTHSAYNTGHYMWNGISDTFQLGYFNHLISAHGLYNFRSRYDVPSIMLNDCNYREEAFTITSTNSARTIGDWPSSHGRSKLISEAFNAFNNDFLLSLLSAGFNFVLLPGRGYNSFGKGSSALKELQSLLNPPHWHLSEEEQIQSILRYAPPKRIIPFLWIDRREDDPETGFAWFEQGRMQWVLRCIGGETFEDDDSDGPGDINGGPRGDLVVWDEERLMGWGYDMPVIEFLETNYGNGELMLHGTKEFWDDWRKDREE
ncbi:hypothetical protein BJ508DRAFT_362347 [Ascobolus immersus RN42]|uniref:Uncharacterized protein n=1 Tax=Ascobolus immersus RN42 TaxID=1160509 RepID=A0A3N4I471_ASCIM|nr:hypothetical protein BJ508DRAFT_362347 [Ascobolus immersus RN42]